MARALQRVGSLLLLAAALLAMAGILAWWMLHASLARLDGRAQLPGLAAPVSVERDAIGVATIRAGSEADAARALGFVHAQERFFEMDLLRRSAAGELSELFGAVALEKDKSVRVHRLRSRIARDLPAVAGSKLAVLTAYTEGVNAGLNQLGTRPWPYLLLRVQPAPWKPEDTALAGYAMFFDLQDESNSRELALWRIRGVVPTALYQLLSIDGTSWDAPLRGAPRADALLPGPDELDLRQLPMPRRDAPSTEAEPAAPGSNNFAVAGALTTDGRALVANDMHLSLRVPNIWFRARLVYTDALAPDGRVDASGFTLPGIPAIVVGSNTHVAWGFTNSYGDWLDFFTVDWADDSHTRYRTQDGEQAIEIVDERIRVKGKPDQILRVRQTRWGPVTAEAGPRRSLALRWTAHQPRAINLGLTGLVRAATVDDALRVAGSIGMPAQNLVVADSSGRIAWRLTGQMPRRVGDCELQAPMDPSAGCQWRGWRQAADNPSLVDPPSGRLWTANARTVDGDALAMIGDAGYANGARAKQIRDALFAQDRFSEADLLAVQLDDRALFLARWWKLLRVQSAGSGNATWQAFEAQTRHWDGRAAPASVSYRLVRDWRLAVIDRVKDGLMAPARVALGDAFVLPDLPQIEGVAWPLVSERPAHLLPRRFKTWDALFLDAAQEVAFKLGRQGPLAERRWGERNTADICHPLAAALPALAKHWLCMPPDAIAGDGNMPRVASPDFGASERMVVSPGHERDGIIHMPGGQSGNPLSPFWGAGHEAWVNGTATPFLPGVTRHRLQLGQ